jgi:hypothetical protein
MGPGTRSHGTGTSIDAAAGGDIRVTGKAERELTKMVRFK